LGRQVEGEVINDDEFWAVVTKISRDLRKGTAMVDTTYIRNDISSILAHMVEECGEVIAALGKTLRWGPNSFDPTVPVDLRERNYEWVLRELDDLESVIARYRAYPGSNMGPRIPVSSVFSMGELTRKLSRLITAASLAGEYGLDSYTPNREIEFLEPEIEAFRNGFA
jgi:hypothetical protein